MRQCNECKRFKCDVPFLFRKGKTFDSRGNLIDMSADCDKYVPPKTWTMKLIFTAMMNSPQGVHDVLKAFDMHLKEMAEKPYFRILLDKIHVR